MTCPRCNSTLTIILDASTDAPRKCERCGFIWW